MATWLTTLLSEPLLQWPTWDKVGGVMGLDKFYKNALSPLYLTPMKGVSASRRWLKSKEKERKQKKKGKVIATGMGHTDFVVVEGEQQVWQVGVWI